jgi:hypothetical protein
MYALPLLFFLQDRFFRYAEHLVDGTVEAAASVSPGKFGAGSGFTSSGPDRKT